MGQALDCDKLPCPTDSYLLHLCFYSRNFFYLLKPLENAMILIQFAAGFLVVILL